MKLYSVLTRIDAEPVLVAEGFSVGALILGPIWLAAHRAWIAAAISFAADVLIAVLVPDPADLILGAGVAVILGLIGRDLRCGSLERRGYLLQHVVGARGTEDAWQRLLAERPELGRRFWPATP